MNRGVPFGPGGSGSSVMRWMGVGRRRPRVSRRFTRWRGIQGSGSSPRGGHRRHRVDRVAGRFVLGRDTVPHESWPSAARARSRLMVSGVPRLLRCRTRRAGGRVSFLVGRGPARIVLVVQWRMSCLAELLRRPVAGRRAEPAANASTRGMTTAQAVTSATPAGRGEFTHQPVDRPCGRMASWWEGAAWWLAEYGCVKSGSSQHPGGPVQPAVGVPVVENYRW
jgi:hypothetical protein